MDLHIHTTNNDIKNILKLAEKNNVKYISITDHDKCNAYFELEKINIKNYYTGIIIPGIEITTSFNNQRIELLAYNFNDYKIVDEYFKKTTQINWTSIMKIEKQKLLRELDDLGLKYEEKFKNLDDPQINKRYETKLYISLLKENPNLKEILRDEYCEDETIFFRKCISNPNSIFYMNYDKYTPKIDDVINFIHSQNGLCFLAHPLGYKIPNQEKFIDDLYDYCNKNCKLDGIEVYHASFNKKEVEYLEKFAKEKNLLISGGSDYHGSEELGLYLNQTKNIPNTIENWEIF